MFYYIENEIYLAVFNYKHESFICYFKLFDNESESLLVRSYKLWLLKLMNHDISGVG